MTDGDFHRSGVGWSGSIGGLCPLQGDGLVDGHAWYFKARGDHWEMVIAEPLGDDVDACDVYLGGVPGWFAREPWGTKPEAVYMPNATGWSFIEATIAKFRAGTLARYERTASA